MAGPPARRCSSWTSRPAASTSPPRPRCTGCWSGWPREGVAILMISSELPEVLHIGGPDPGHARGAADRRVSATRTPRRRRSWPRRPASWSRRHERRRVTPAPEPAGTPPRQAARAGSPSGCSGSASPASSPSWSCSSRSPRHPAAFLSQQKHPVPADQHHRLRAARAGRDDGGRQPERGPVDRFGARPVGLRVGQPVRRRSTASRSRWSSWSAWASGWPVGVANGLMVAIGRVPSLVVTLATLYIIRGIDILIVGGNAGRRPDPAQRLHPTSRGRTCSGSRTWPSRSRW